jgi:hypothetical protein
MLSAGRAVLPAPTPRSGCLRGELICPPIPLALSPALALARRFRRPFLRVRGLPRLRGRGCGPLSASVFSVNSASAPAPTCPDFYIGIPTSGWFNTVSDFVLSSFDFRYSDFVLSSLIPPPLHNSISPGLSHRGKPFFSGIALPPQLSGRPTEENHAYTVLSPWYDLTRNFSITPRHHPRSMCASAPISPPFPSQYSKTPVPHPPKPHHPTPPGPFNPQPLATPQTGATPKQT